MGEIISGISLIIAWACIMALQADVRSLKQRMKRIESGLWGKDVN